MNEELFIVCLGSQPFFASTAQAIEDGIPRRRFVKEIIRTGLFVKASAGQKIPVTREWLQNWAVQFGRMQANGVRVTIPATHEGHGNPDLNRGYVDDLFVEPNKDGGLSLFMACTLIGEDAILAASRSDVSIYSRKEFIDGKGNKYDRPIIHVALVTDPVVPGLSEFIPLAASLKGAAMDPMELLQKIAAAIGVTDAIDESNAETLIVPALNSLVDKVGKAGDAATGTGTVAAAANASAPAGGGVVKKVTTEFAASVSAVTAPLISANRKLRIEAARTARKITTAQATDLLKKYVEPSDLAETIAASMEAGGTPDAEFDAVMRVVEANAPALGERTSRSGRQVIELSDGRKSEPGENRLLKNAEERAQRAAASR